MYMLTFNDFKKHYLKVTGRGELAPTEEFFLRTFYNTLGIPDEDIVIAKCPTCETEYVHPTS